MEKSEVMEQYMDNWRNCLQIVAGKVSPHVYDIWFKDITMEAYDPGRRAVLLSVPHRYVYEYIEEVQAPMLKQALDSAFGASVRLNYRIRKEPPSAAAAVDFPAVGQIPRLAVAGARERLENGLRHFLGDKAQWLPCYGKIANWLSDNKGRGLLCVGSPGLGKTLICEKILPVLVGREFKAVTATEMPAQIDELVKERYVIIDDLGREPAEYKSYGNVRKPFFELCDAAERNGILLIITTNLSTSAVNNPLYPDSIERRYGMDVISRLRATTSVVVLEGTDMRR